jgi:hypothetical protein
MPHDDGGESRRVGWDGRHSPAAATPLRQRTSTQAVPTVLRATPRGWRVPVGGVRTASRLRLTNLTAW